MDAESEQTDGQSPGFFNSKLCIGLILFVAVGLALAYAGVKFFGPMVAKARVVSDPLPPQVFPSLEVTGVIIDGPRSSAIINGANVRLGDFIEEVQLVEVQEDQIVVELEGERQSVPRAIPGEKASATGSKTTSSSRRKRR